MKKLFEVKLVPIVVGQITQLIVRVENISYAECIELLNRKFPEYLVISVLEGYQKDTPPT